MIVYFSAILWLSFIYPVSILMLSETIISFTCHNPAEIKGFVDFG